MWISPSEFDRYNDQLFQFKLSIGSLNTNKAFKKGFFPALLTLFQAVLCNLKQRSNSDLHLVRKPTVTYIPSLSLRVPTSHTKYKCNNCWGQNLVLNILCYVISLKRKVFLDEIFFNERDEAMPTLDIQLWHKKSVRLS